MVSLGGWTASPLSGLLAVGPLAASAEPSRAVLFAMASLLLTAAMALDTVGAIVRVGRRLGPGERLLGLVILVSVVWFVLALFALAARPNALDPGGCDPSGVYGPC